MHRSDLTKSEEKERNYICLYSMMHIILAYISCDYFKTQFALSLASAGSFVFNQAVQSMQQSLVPVLSIHKPACHAQHLNIYK